jgi:hypothetical protein
MKVIEKLKRVVSELRAGPAVPVDMKKMKGELQGLMFGMRCVMAHGGYKLKPPGMTDKELEQRSDNTTTMAANLHIMVRCAEKVLLRHGLTEEYVGLLKYVEDELAKAPTLTQSDQLAVQRAINEAGVKAVKDGKDGDVQATG